MYGDKGQVIGGGMSSPSPGSGYQGQSPTLQKAFAMRQAAMKAQPSSQPSALPAYAGPPLPFMGQPAAPTGGMRDMRYRGGGMRPRPNLGNYVTQDYKPGGVSEMLRRRQQMMQLMQGGGQLRSIAQPSMGPPQKVYGMAEGGQMYTPGDLVRRFAMSLRPNRMKAMLPSTQGMQDSVISALGTPPEDFRASVMGSYPGGIDPSRIVAGNY